MVLIFSHSVESSFAGAAKPFLDRPWRRVAHSARLSTVGYPVSQTAAACDGAIKVVGIAPVWQD